jgi:HEAT repeat protein
MKRSLAAILLIMIAGCGGKSTTELITQMRSKDSAERIHAVKALSERRNDVAMVVPALTEALKDPDAFVRRDAASALGKLGADAREAIPALIAAQSDKNASVRSEVAKSLRLIDPNQPVQKPQASTARSGTQPR